jgi:hypothetical protein
MADLEEYELWDFYPQLHHWFNKLWLAEQLGYKCGPSGYAPKKSGEYIVRPIYNLAGMGLGASKTHILAGDRSCVPPGSFWCEYFDEPHYSVTYEYKFGKWKPLHSWHGYFDESNLSCFTLWTRSEHTPELPTIFEELKEVEQINVEFRGDRPIEVHLRPSGNPDGSTGRSPYNEYVPIWQSTKDSCYEYLEQGYSFLDCPESADGLLSDSRIGFMVR